MIGSIHNSPIITIKPRMMPTIMIIEKFCFAFLGSPSPMFFAIMALPPVASMMAIAIIILGMGNTIFNADKAFSPTKLDTKTASVIWYKDINTSIIQVGAVNFNNDVMVKFCANLFSIKNLLYITFFNSTIICSSFLQASQYFYYTND